MSRAAQCVHPQGNTSLVPYGDVNGSGVVNVADTVCAALATLWQLEDPGGPAPGCLAGGFTAADLDCSGVINVADVLLSVWLALDAPLPPEIDEAGDGCADGCVGCVGPLELSCLIDGACVPNGEASGFDPCIGCNALADEIDFSPLPDGTPCGQGLACQGGVCEAAQGGDTPTGVIAIASDVSATVGWSAPTAPSAAVTGYVVTVYAPGGGPPAGVAGAWVRSTGSLATSFVFSGLTNGLTYQFTVAAISASGLGPESALSNPVTPVGPPSAPFTVVAAAGDGSATVTFSAPMSDGGAPITEYLLTALPSGATQLASGSPTVFTGLPNGVPVQFTVAAVNESGTGLPSLPSNFVIPTGVPGAPIIAAAYGQDAQIALLLVAPADTGGGPLTGYVASCVSLDDTSMGTGASGGGVVVITGLTNGLPHVCTATAVNAAGAGPPSAPSEVVVPQVVIQGSGVVVARPVGLAGTSLVDPPPAFASSAGVVATPAAYLGERLYDAAPTLSESAGVVAAPAAYVGGSLYDFPPALSESRGAVAAPAAYLSDSLFDPALAAEGSADTGGAVAPAAAYLSGSLFDSVPETDGSVDTGGAVAPAAAYRSAARFDDGSVPVRRGALVARGVAAVGRPYVTQVDPSAVSPLSGTVALTLHGVGFEAATDLLFYDPWGNPSAALVAGEPVVSADGRSLTALLSLSPSADVGEWTVVVQTSSGYSSPISPPAPQQGYDNVITVTP